MIRKLRTEPAMDAPSRSYYARPRQNFERDDLQVPSGKGALQVYPVAAAVPIAKQAGARVVVINAQQMQFDEIADALLPGPISTDLPLVVRGVG